MRRQKRDRNQRAFTRGYQVGCHGKSKELCPFQEGETRQTWISGWRTGREDNWDGFTGVAGVARQPQEIRH
ncbi:MAG: ribosome modulation factor [Candidatus Azotimanducaceae bacterium]|jgi:ribosome modulation factor